VGLVGQSSFPGWHGSFFGRCRNIFFSKDASLPRKNWPVRLCTQFDDRVQYFWRVSRGRQRWRRYRGQLAGKSYNPLYQFPRSKSVTSWREQKSVASCRFPNSITTTCCGLVSDILHVMIVCHVANKSATSWQLLRLWES